MEDIMRINAAKTIMYAKNMYVQTSTSNTVTKTNFFLFLSLLLLLVFLVIPAPHVHGIFFLLSFNSPHLIYSICNGLSLLVSYCSKL